jgi:hypothetical protein
VVKAAKLVVELDIVLEELDTVLLSKVDCPDPATPMTVTVEIPPATLSAPLTTQLDKFELTRLEIIARI